ncbi:cation diffusion facilitator family transporter [Mucilaginibacter sp.]|uniref:cation diffusion facilitator family transporter n=1 Tax=Mucilaginibacter sp. TaxID=1882438 RepID=UPI003265639A
MASSKTSIYAALIANLLIAITKFIAGGISNSAAMVAEGVHSVVDTVNELLLLLGIHRSKKLPDATHPFGYGKELYFWSFIVSIMIFGLGGGISIYQGIAHIIKPEELGDPTINYIVLGLSIVFEGASLIIAIKQFNQIRGATPFWQAVVKSKDPSSFLVLFEDAAAVAGLFIVMICVYISHSLNKPYIDGVASLLVGLILVVVSAILARESRSLLMGEGVSSQTRDKICRMVEGDGHVVKVQHILSTYQSPTEVLLMLIVAFKEDMDTEEINKAIDRIRDVIKTEFNLVRFVIIQPESLEHHVLWNDDKH